uniref:Uncharacterized protein n=1 Tax=Arundo donax TaxID=35708 RepID=A0A0A9FGF5_ARUDO
MSFIRNFLFGTGLKKKESKNILLMCILSSSLTSTDPLLCSLVAHGSIRCAYSLLSIVAQPHSKLLVYS